MDIVGHFLKDPRLTAESFKFEVLIQAGASERRREGFSLATMDFTQVGVSERRRRRPNKGRKCPTVEQIKAKMGEGMEGEHVKVEENFFNVEQWQYREDIQTVD